MQCRTDNHGFTLIELLVTVSVLGILLGLAVPSYQNTLAKRRLIGAVEQLHSDFQFARSESSKQGQILKSVRFYFTQGATWCYGMDDDMTLPVCNCSSSPASCTVNGAVKIVDGTGFSGVSLDVSWATPPFFNPRRGTIAPGNASFTANGREARVISADGGRTKLCSDLAADANYLGYQAC